MCPRGNGRELGILKGLHRGCCSGLGGAQYGVQLACKTRLCLQELLGQSKPNNSRKLKCVVGLVFFFFPSSSRQPVRRSEPAALAAPAPGHRSGAIGVAGEQPWNVGSVRKQTSKQTRQPDSKPAPPPSPPPQKIRPTKQAQKPQKPHQQTQSVREAGERPQPPGKCSSPSWPGEGQSPCRSLAGPAGSCSFFPSPSGQRPMATGPNKTILPSVHRSAGATAPIGCKQTWRRVMAAAAGGPEAV